MSASTRYTMKDERVATERDAVEFLDTIAKLEAEGKKATFAHLGSGRFLEAARQIARKNGWCAYVGGKGWGADRGRPREGAPTALMPQGPTSAGT